MSYRPLTPYRRDCSTATADDEAYEMYATRSAANNTVRVVDDSYRPLASSEDTRSRASSHSEASESPVVREPIPSAPRQDETTDDHEFSRSKLHKPGEELQYRMTLQRFKASYVRGALDTWLYEIAALAFSAGCLVALAVMLGIYNGRQTPQMPYNITLNALISVLSTAAKSSLLFAVAGTLGQIKWAWFTESRELSDMQTFDGATRGPWGALVLLCSRSIRPLASLGAVITILALAYGPFLQQLVRYPVIYESVWSDYATTMKSRSLSATSNFTFWDSARAAAWLEISQFDRDPGCPTGNCTWPKFTSLEYCSKCAVTTAETSVLCSSDFDTWDAKSNETCEIYPDQGYPATVFQGIATNSTKYSYAKLDSIVWLVRETSPWGWNNALYEPFLTPDPVPKSAFQSVTGTQYSYLGVDNPMLVLAYASFEGDTLSDPDFDHPLDRSSAPVLAKAETCIITPCERTYQLSMTAGQVQRVVLDTDYGVSEILGWPKSSDEYDGANSLEGCWRTTSHRGGSDAPLEECTPEDSDPVLSNPAITSCHEVGGDPVSGSMFCSPASPAHGLSRIGVIGRKGIRASWENSYWDWETEQLLEELDVMTMGFPTIGKPISQAIQAHNFSYLVERMAASMTKAQLDDGITMHGNMISGMVQVDVAWYWFIFPATLNVLATLLLLATAVLSHHRKTQLWKSSTLALLYHGLDNPEPVPDINMARVSEMEQWASATSATLGSTKDGGRIVLRTVPREHASNGLGDKTDGV
jgi:hypothetical protein